MSRTTKPSRVLLDTGPLVAWMNSADTHHRTVATWFADYRGELITTWPVLTEVCHLVPERLAPRVLHWVHAGGATVFDVSVDALLAMAERMEKYADLPMDLADATLLWVAEREGVMDILTLDARDFGVYHTARGRALRDVLGAAAPDPARRRRS